MTLPGPRLTGNMLQNPLGGNLKQLLLGDGTGQGSLTTQQLRKVQSAQYMAQNTGRYKEAGRKPGRETLTGLRD